MFIAAGVTAVVAALALGAGFALIDLEDGETDRRPAAVGPEAVGDDWAFFAGSPRWDGLAHRTHDRRQRDGRR